MAEWDARLYSKFERERTLPARDLCAAIPRDRAERIIDIGCGIGTAENAVFLQKLSGGGGGYQGAFVNGIVFIGAKAGGE